MSLQNKTMLDNFRANQEEDIRNIGCNLMFLPGEVLPAFRNGLECIVVTRYMLRNEPGFRCFDSIVSESHPLTGNLLHLKGEGKNKRSLVEQKPDLRRTEL